MADILGVGDGVADGVEEVEDDGDGVDDEDIDGEGLGKHFAIDSSS